MKAYKIEYNDMGVGIVIAPDFRTAESMFFEKKAQEAERTTILNPLLRYRLQIRYLFMDLNNMELSKQVTSLDISKRLKELGVKQDSFFQWGKSVYNGEYVVSFPERREIASQRELNDEPGSRDYYDFISAFTSAEMGEMLPRTLGEYPLTCIKMHGWNWSVSYEIEGDESVKQAPNEADARGLMLTHLLEQGIIKPNQ